ncbi:MAG: hypothetical protein C3F13_07675 [Anaerolineales bacterium]|nr:MAG: hypothetical protein C3F13_07675 [Anaerolineales bacterium]
MDLPLKPGIKKKNARALAIIAIEKKIMRGTVSLGSSPFRRMRGIVQMISKMKMGRMASGDTSAPVSEERNGKEVSGRLISASAHKTSQTNSHFVL